MRLTTPVLGVGLVTGNNQNYTPDERNCPDYGRKRDGVLLVFVISIGPRSTAFFQPPTTPKHLQHVVRRSDTLWRSQ